MDRDEVLQGILKILKPYKARSGNSAPLTESTSLTGELDIDSPRMVDIVLDAEEKFGIRIDDSQITNFETVGDIVNMVQKLVDAKK